MSGAEVIGIISGTIAIIDAIVKVHAAATDASGLPQAFRDVAKRLPLVRETLQATREYLHTNPDEKFCAAMRPVLEDCEEKTGRLQAIFKNVVPQPGASRAERYLQATRTLGKGDTVESTMEGIERNVHLLTSNHVAHLPTRAEISDIMRVAIAEKSTDPPSLPAAFGSTTSRDTERNALLTNLKWANPILDKERIEMAKGGLYEEASRWILTHPKYYEWRHGGAKSLWIKGDAGKGKTMLLIAITKELQPCTKLSNPAAESFLSFFFCQNTDDRLNNAVAVLKGLIYLLLAQDSSLVSYLKNDTDLMGKEIFDATSNPNAFNALSKVFMQMVQHPRSETIYLVVDALDECKDDRPDLLNLITRTLKEDHLKWIVTSRNHVNVDESLALSLEVNSTAVLQAIKVYIEHKVSRIPSLKSNPVQRADIQQQLVEKAEGTFLWVDLVLRSIHDALANDMVGLIDEIPKGLPLLYDRMMQNIRMSTSADRDLCLTTLSIATLAYRPLHLLELQTLAGLEKYDVDDLERIVDMCGSFLTLLESHIYPIHQSAKDYLVSTAAVDKIFPSGTQTVHRSIVERSVAAMERALSRDMYALVHPGTLVHEVIVPPNKGPLLKVGYSCAHWIDHVCKAVESDPQKGRRSRLVLGVLKQHFKPSKSTTRISDLVITFFQHHFLHWLEALSLLGVVPNGVLSLTRFRDIIPVSLFDFEQHLNRYLSNNRATIKDTFVNLIEDAYRFIQYNRWIIEHAPLQTYTSILLFAPTTSIIRNLFKAEEPIWVLTKPVVDQNWSPCLQIFEGHARAVFSVAFSPDGSHIASGSDDKTIRIWDAKSGKEIHKLEGHSSRVNSVAFSPDGNYVVSGSFDQTIRIWDAKSGKEIHKLVGHSSYIISVAFSPDGNYIASGSNDTTIRTWDAKSGKEIHKLKGHSSFVESITFSPDSNYIASGSGDNAIWIRHVKSGKETHRLKGHIRGVGSVAFSPDGNYIASCLDDYIIRIWDAKSGKEIHKLEGHSSLAISVAFSPDGNYIASGSNDATIRIWDAKSGKEIHKLKGHSSFVESITFSPDSNYIASGSGDNTIWIRHVKSEKEPYKLEGHFRTVYSVAFSPDGNYIASGSADETIRIWHAKSGNERYNKLEGHSSQITSIAFSPDGNYIASGSFDQTIWIWNAKSGDKIHKLEGHSSYITSVAFSPDGNYIASGSFDHTIRIWHAKSGKEINKFEGSSPVILTTFSPDGNHLKSRFFGKITRIWNAKSGQEIHNLEDQNKLFPTHTSDESNRVWGLSYDGSWITWCGRKTIWLPPDFRSLKSAISNDGSGISLGCHSGRVVIMRMSSDVPFS